MVGEKNLLTVGAAGGLGQEMHGCTLPWPVITGVRGRAETEDVHIKAGVAGQLPDQIDGYRLDATDRPFWYDWKLGHDDNFQAFAQLCVTWFSRASILGIALSR